MKVVSDTAFYYYTMQGTGQKAQGTSKVKIPLCEEFYYNPADGQYILQKIYSFITT